LRNRQEFNEERISKIFDINAGCFVLKLDEKEVIK
jgi:hypothetical protein